MLSASSLSRKGFFNFVEPEALPKVDAWRSHTPHINLPTTSETPRGGNSGYYRAIAVKTSFL